MIREELYKGMGERRPKLAWIELSGEGINWTRSLSADASRCEYCALRLEEHSHGTGFWRK